MNQEFVFLILQTVVSDSETTKRVRKQDKFQDGSANALLPCSKCKKKKKKKIVKLNSLSREMWWKTTRRCISHVSDSCSLKRKEETKQKKENIKLLKTGEPEPVPCAGKVNWASCRDWHREPQWPQNRQSLQLQKSTHTHICTHIHISPCVPTWGKIRL